MELFWFQCDKGQITPPPASIREVQSPCQIGLSNAIVLKLEHNPIILKHGNFFFSIFQDHATMKKKTIFDAPHTNVCRHFSGLKIYHNMKVNPLF